MKNTVLDILIYLFEHYIDDSAEISIDHDALKVELTESGFDETQISEAFDWLQGLAEQQDQLAIDVDDGNTSIRVYTQEEQDKLALESRGFLLFLEQIGVLNHHSRELVLERVMALESDDIELEQLKWIVLMVLFNQPGQEDAVHMMEDLVMDEQPGILH